MTFRMGDPRHYRVLNYVKLCLVGFRRWPWVVSSDFSGSDTELARKLGPFLSVVQLERGGIAIHKNRRSTRPKTIFGSFLFTVPHHLSVITAYRVFPLLEVWGTRGKRQKGIGTTWG